MISANAELFDQPQWQVIACGFDTERWFNDGQAVGTGGILMPQPTRLLAGHFYYRFASSRSSAEAQLGGGWWLDYEGFRTVSAFAAEHGYRLKDAARLMLALPYAWTAVDLLIKALLLQPLRAYTGLGKPAQGPQNGPDRGTRWIPTQYQSVRQIYIPGLFVPGPRSASKQQLYRTVFQQPVTVTSLD